MEDMDRSVLETHSILKALEWVLKLHNSPATPKKSH